MYSQFLKGYTIITADDSLTQIDRNVACALKYGMIVKGTYENGRDAVQGALQHKPNIALLDIAMSPMTGIEAAQQIKLKLPDIKIVLVTSTAQKDAINLDLSHADAYLVKPFPDEWFLQKIYSVLVPSEADAPEMNHDG